MAAPRRAQIELRDVDVVYVKGVRKIYALRGVNLEVYPGEFVLLLGPTGSGKTTMLNVIAGIERPTRGVVLVEGRNLADLSQEELAEWRRRKIGIIFQFFNLLPHLTALENVMIPLLVDKSISMAMIRKKASELLDRLGLEDKKDRFPRELSGGEQQRVAIARALITEPTILLADEPVAHLDQAAARVVLDIFREVNRAGKTVILATTHEGLLRELRDVVTKVVRLEHGQVKEVRQRRVR